MPLPKAVLLLLSLPLLAACEGSAPPATSEADAVAVPAVETAATTPSAAPVSDAALAPLVGTFAADLSWCDGEAGGDGFPVTITPTEFRGRENVCAINGITDLGDGRYEASLTCTGEGQTVDERLELVPIFAPSGEGLRITYTDRGEASTTLLRCS
ncbi:MAG TPA: hypothetical protein VGN80_08815 [Devosiaceae bacterium]|jgi:hypothetical protein|nr:hypothetical protein [Devosiaceae bacterium]